MEDEITQEKISGIFESRGRIIIKNIIKEQIVNYSKPVPVGGEGSFNKPEVTNSVHQHEIEPIIENDEVVGIIHHCSCGKSTEIRFDY